MADQLEVCLQDFLKFLIANPNLLSAYKTFVTGSIASLDAQIAATELVIVQMVTILNVEGLALNAYDAIIKQASSTLNIMPFKQFETCESVNTLIQGVNSLIDPYDNFLLGNVKEKLYENKKRNLYIESIKKVNDGRKQIKQTLTNTLLFIDTNSTT